MKRLLISLIHFYQIFLSFDTGVLRVFAPGGACRFNPSCSEYFKQAILRYGIFKGCVFGLKRILLCNPFIQSQIREGGG